MAAVCSLCPELSNVARRSGWGARAARSAAEDWEHPHGEVAREGKGWCELYFRLPAAAGDPGGPHSFSVEHGPLMDAPGGCLASPGVAWQVARGRWQRVAPGGFGAPRALELPARAVYFEGLPFPTWSGAAEDGESDAEQPGLDSSSEIDSGGDNDGDGSGGDGDSDGDGDDSSGGDSGIWSR